MVSRKKRTKSFLSKTSDIKFFQLFCLQVFCLPEARDLQWPQQRSTFHLRDLFPHSSVSCSPCPRPGGINNNYINNNYKDNENNKRGITHRQVSWPVEADTSSKTVSSGTMDSGCTLMSSSEPDTRPRTTILMKASS